MDAQYQFNTSYGNTSLNTLDRQGFLEQDIYRCTDECKAPGITGAQYCETFSISDKLNGSSSSAPVYAVVGSSVENFTKDNPDIDADTLGIANDGTPANPNKPPVALLDLTPSYVLGGTKAGIGHRNLGNK